MAEDLVYQSLERVAEVAGDLNDAIYSRYFELCPASAELMSHTDEGMRGRMLDEVYRLLLNPEPEAELEYLMFEVDNHRAYGAEVDMYSNVLAAVRDVVKATLGEGWDKAAEKAWAERLDALEGIIRRAA